MENNKRILEALKKMPESERSKVHNYGELVRHLEQLCSGESARNDSGDKSVLHGTQKRVVGETKESAK